MTISDVLIVGGGPAGSSCARLLRQEGADVAVLDKAAFPRDKPCAGWITPQVVALLDIDVDDYQRGRTLQSITGFVTGVIHEKALETRFDATVSYGIRRCEFDTYLLERSGARMLPPTLVSRVERRGTDWIINDTMVARTLVGAGGHFCPVARKFTERSDSEPVVVAREIECQMTPAQADRCRVGEERPELYFCRDLKGYGWCFRKGEYLNVGIGRQDPHALTRHVEDFLVFLRERQRIPDDLPFKWKGHAYFLYDSSPRPLTAENAVLIGDAAGLAYSRSGEGIRTAIESGLLAADAIVQAQRSASSDLSTYERAMTTRFGQRNTAVPKWREVLTTTLGPTAFKSAAFTKHVLLGRWFLHLDEQRQATESHPRRTAGKAA